MTKKRILLVDDEPVVLAVSAKMLEHLGYDVETCAEGTEALMRFQERPSRMDLVMMDLWMPGVRGDELARRFLEIRPDLPILLCSGDRCHPEDLDAGRSGVHCVLSKPIRLQELDRALQSAWKRDAEAPPVSP